MVTVLSGRKLAGSLLGTWNGLDKLDSGDVPEYNNMFNVYGSVAQGRFGLTTAQVDKVFPGRSSPRSRSTRDVPGHPRRRPPYRASRPVRRPSSCPRTPGRPRRGRAAGVRWRWSSGWAWSPRSDRGGWTPRPDRSPTPPTCSPQAAGSPG
ncbi:hypothetical protein V2I01_03405 [Micromonospora sp. BRA006-A]|nr:hypothetical protein [Micromonospora sp. BRA006-A]